MDADVEADFGDVVGFRHFETEALPGIAGGLNIGPGLIGS